MPEKSQPVKRLALKNNTGGQTMRRTTRLAPSAVRAARPRRAHSLHLLGLQLFPILSIVPPYYCPHADVARPRSYHRHRDPPPEAAIRATGGGVSEVRALPPPVVPFPEERRQMLKRVPLPHFLTRDG